MAFEELKNSKTRLPTVKGFEQRDAVTIVTGSGELFTGWKSVNITKNIQSIANGFSIELHENFLPLSRSWPLKPGVLVKINVGRERVLTGRIEQLEAGFDVGNRSFSVSGRSLPGDLVESSVSGPAEYTNVDLEELAKKLIEPFGLKVFLSVTPKKIDKFGVKPGESVFEALDRAARLQGFFWISTRGGNIRLTRAARARATDDLAQDFNLKSANVRIDTTMRHNEIKVIGQSAGTENLFGPTAAQPEGSASDAGIARHRPLTVVAEASITTDQAIDRAQWEIANRLADGQEITASVQSWQQSDGELWDINQLVRFKSQTLGLNTDLLIASVEQSKSNDGGTVTNLTLVRKDAFTPQPVVPANDDNLFDLGAT